VDLWILSLGCAHLDPECDVAKWTNWMHTMNMAWSRQLPLEKNHPMLHLLQLFRWHPPLGRVEKVAAVKQFRVPCHPLSSGWGHNIQPFSQPAAAERIRWTDVALASPRLRAAHVQCIAAMDWTLLRGRTFQVCAESHSSLHTCSVARKPHV
jgi:hypothetical protein